MKNWFSSDLCSLQHAQSLHLEVFNKGPNSTSPISILELLQKAPTKSSLRGVWINKLLTVYQLPAKWNRIQSPVYYWWGSPVWWHDHLYLIRQSRNCTTVTCSDFSKSTSFIKTLRRSLSRKQRRYRASGSANDFCFLDSINRQKFSPWLPVVNTTSHRRHKEDVSKQNINLIFITFIIWLMWRTFYLILVREIMHKKCFSAWSTWFDAISVSPRKWNTKSTNMFWWSAKETRKKRKMLLKFIIARYRTWYVFWRIIIGKLNLHLVLLAG